MNDKIDRNVHHKDILLETIVYSDKLLFELFGGFDGPQIILITPWKLRIKRV